MEFETKHGKVTVRRASYFVGARKPMEMQLEPPGEEGWTVGKTLAAGETPTQEAAEQFAARAMAYL